VRRAITLADLLGCFPSLTEVLCPTIIEQVAEEAAQSALWDFIAATAKSGASRKRPLNGLRRPDLAVAQKQTNAWTA
jgi:lauroyl/myristoyl acyltransferase